MPESEQRDAKLANAATALAFVCLVVLAATTLPLLVPSMRTWISFGRSSAGYRVGDRIEIAGSPYRRASRTVLIFSRSSCGACQSSKRLFTSLVSDLSAASNVAAVLVTPDSLVEEETRFAHDVGIPADRVLRTDLNNFNLRMVPTLVVVDSEGRVLKVHEGILTEAVRHELVLMAHLQVADLR
jgi:hypothetical protein